ncbi:hypothetical protein I3843_16G111800 [Carya illinoinensis]|uniref:Calcineurin-like phosphoesterase domain-containing protein n=1 Tax=Carya illinoinensis TaxID=32201 RepID=A0A922A7J1_CARIL|nr:hypothetical protein I3760_16G115500 [Carya illinoinensis]KAG6673476.1 hypothetical protein I3842_16G114200 [Carya illinoinensis]KAG7942598.1 hypothetical protein I3843_16G111800 [Carya illinoinensis]
MEKPSWFRTIFVQVSLCFVLYLALNLGQPQKPIQRNRSGNRALDLYFISVRGGFRPLKQQTHLLKLMDKVAKAYNVSFVVNTSELGEDDPLMQNGTAFFSSLKVPWYTTRTTKGHGVCCFLEQIKLPYGKTLDIVGVDTGSLQDLMLRGSSSEIGHSQLHWLTRTLEAISGNWRIVVGFHQLVACEENNEQMEAKQLYELLHHTFVRFGVNAYLSGHDCTKHVRPGNIAYIGNPASREKEPYSATVSGQPALNGELVNGFLLHRVSAIEIATYFISSAGEIVHEIVLQHRGKEVM